MRTNQGLAKITALCVGLLILAGSVMAQQGRGMGPGGMGPMKHAAMQQQLPQLTEEQQKQVQVLRDEFQKEIIPLRNDLNVLKAKLVSLQDDVTPDMKAINENIDQQTGLMNKIMKARAAHQVKVKAITGFMPGQGYGPHHGFQDKGPQRGWCPMMNQ